MRVLFDYVLTG